MDNEEILKNFTEVEGSRLKALEYVSNGESRYKNDQGNIGKCASLRMRTGNQPLDLLFSRFVPGWLLLSDLFL